MMSRRIMIAMAAAGMVALAIPSAATAETYRVSAKDNHYTPAFRVIGVGDAVVWRNDGELDHTVTAFRDGGKRAFDSSPDDCPPEGGGTVPLPGGNPENGCLEPGQEFRYTFTKAGTYDYFCRLHAPPSESVRPDPSKPSTGQPCAMCGRIVVQAPTSPKPVSTTTSRPGPAPPTPTSSETPTPTPTPTTGDDGEPAASPTPELSGVPAAARGGGAARTGIALAAIAALGGAGYWTWRRFLAPR